jgi:hypothetical protein
MKNVENIFSKLPQRFQWTFHNMISHPLSEIFYQLGFEELGNKIHDYSIPNHKPGTGRG